MHLFLPVRLLAVLLAATGMGLAASKRGGGPMKRVKRVLEGDAATTTTTTTSTTATKATKNKLTDSWATDAVLKGAKRLMNGDNAGVLLDMSMGKEMEEIFSNPDAAHTLLQVFPMFKTLRGVEALAAKAKEDFTLEDSMSVLGSYRNFVTAALKGVKDMADPVRLATTMNEYSDAVAPQTLQADGTHRSLTAEEHRMAGLVDRLQGGDTDALHDDLAEKIWNGAIDLSAFKGKEPDAIKQIREMIMEQEPALFDLITGDDPLVKQVLTDPSMLFEVASESFLG